MKRRWGLRDKECEVVFWLHLGTGEEMKVRVRRGVKMGTEEKKMR